MKYEYAVGPHKLTAEVSLGHGLDPTFAASLEAEMEAALETETYTELMIKFLKEEWLVKHPTFFDHMNTTMMDDRTHQVFYEEFAKSYLLWAIKLAGVEIITKTKTP